MNPRRAYASTLGRSVAWWSVLAGLAVACSERPTRTSAARCEAAAAELAQWVKVLAAEGHHVLSPERGLEPVLLETVAPAPFAFAPTVIATREHVTYQGALVATHDTIAGDDDGTPTNLIGHLRLTRTQLAKDGVADATLAVYADARVPWRSIKMIGQDATRAGFTHLRFVFRGKTRLTDPPPSWLDAESGPLREVVAPDAPVPDLGAAMRRAADPTRRRVFDRCPSGRALFDSLGAPENERKDRGALIAAGIAAAFRACDCAEEPAAVKRMMWDLWSRYESNMPHATILVRLAPQGAPLQIDPQTPWAEAHAVVVARAPEAIAF